MSMSRKDYEQFAEVLRSQVDNTRTIRLVEGANGVAGNLVSGAMASMVSTIAYNMAGRFTADNERFDHLRFYEACGFLVEGNYPLVFSDQRV